MIDQYKNLKKHLQTQIKTAVRLDSKWVYILREEAEKCYFLADAEETLLSEPVHADVEGGDQTWWYVCSDCRTSISPSDKFCRECGKRIKW